MDGYIDQGKIPVAGYINADPPGQSQFALTAAGSAFANTLEQAGGEVTIDNLGGVGLIASSGSQLGIDSLANIFLRTTSTGTILLQTTGSGDDVDIVNAGTIVFDSLGQGALLNVQTINGTVYPPPGSGATTSITQANAVVACLGSGGVLISSIGTGVDVEVYNAGTIRFDTAGVGAIENLSTVNGVAYPPNFVIPSDITVSTLTAGGYVSTLVLEGVSSFVGASDFVMSATNTSIVGSNSASLLDAGGSGVNITAGEVRLQASSYGVKVEGDMNVSSLSGVSTINGIAWPLTVLGDTANTYVTADGTYVRLGGSGSGYALQVSSDNSIIVGSATANTEVVFASTIQASSDGLKVFELAGGANLNLDTAGKVSFNTGATTATNGDGIAIAPEGVALYFPLDTTASFGVGQIENISTINGTVYPPAVVATRQATYYNSVAQNLTSGNTDLSFDSTGAWNNPDGYITHTNGTTDFTVAQAGLYELEFNAHILANGSTWSGTKAINITLTRSPTALQAVAGQSAAINSNTNYKQSVSATLYLEAGDVINLRINNTYSTGTPTAPGILNVVDLNNFFTWRFIS